MRLPHRSSALLLAILACAPPAQPQTSQPAQTARACVTDAHGHPLAGVQVFELDGTSSAFGKGGRELGLTGADGCVTFPFASGNDPARIAGTLSAGIAGYAQATAPYPSGAGTASLVLRPDTVQQAVTVTANRGLPGADTLSPSVLGLSGTELLAEAGLALDDRLRQVAGFELFRRTSSWTANPTSQGVSLRGLGSTAASRTLVVSDQVPLNDAFGGWVHWNEIPTLAIASISLLRGGAADLYGSSAIGGVVDVVPARPTGFPDSGSLASDISGAPGLGSGTGVPSASTHPVPAILRLSADASGATENSALGDGLVSTETRAGMGLAALSVLSTGGYVPTAPAARGLVDIPSNVRSESGRLELRPPMDTHGDAAFLRGNILNEARSNGTPLQTNGTRLWRYQAGADALRGANTAALRLFGSRETYRQSFSSIPLNRNSETLTRLQRVPTDELGFALQGAHAFPAALTASAGLDVRDIRATDAESPVSSSVVTGTTDISARQREVGGFLDGEWQPPRWTITGSVRVDSFRTFNARQTSTGSAAVTPLPEIDELVASPHLGVSRELGHGLSLSANAFRAFRGPTMNELYRTGQVGQQTTLANNSLLSERATGYAFGGTASGHLVSVRAEFFWTEVDRPIFAVLLSQTASGAQTLERENLGQIRSRGLSLDAHTAPVHNVEVSLSYQLAFATVTAFRSNSPAQDDLTGRWIPQVPRESLTAGLHYTPLVRSRQAIALHAFATYTGEQFDDAENQYVLHPFARVDVSADRNLTHGLSAFASVQNLLNRAIDAGRTPVLTLAAPRLVQAGLRYSFAR